MMTSKLTACAAAAAIPTGFAVTDQATAKAAGTRHQEAELRVAALVMDAGQRIGFVSCDSMNVPPGVYEAATQQIADELGIPRDNLLICATHTHHAPCTITCFNSTPDAAFCRGMQEGIVSTVRQCVAGLDAAATGGPPADAQLLFAESQEASIGQNSRYLLKDGTIAWFAYPWEDVVRPTGPYDPDLPVLAFRRPTGEMIGLVFNHSVHNIGAYTQGAISPGMYGLAAQELEKRHGGVAVFLPGAFGSTHNTSYFGSNENIHAIPAVECVHRICGAVDEGLQDTRALDLSTVRVLRRPFTYRMRHFDEAAQAAAVKYWSEKYTPDSAEGQQRTFAKMRAEMAPVQGEERQTWLHVMRLGDVALVGLPGEVFARHGLRIRRHSPFRDTYVVGLANDTIGYIGDEEGYRLGGYQLWAGTHSLSGPGTGEAMVAQVLQMLDEVAGDG